MSNQSSIPVALYNMCRDRISPPEDTKPNFSGKNIIVTGANVGLGLEAAVKFVACGAAKVILGVRSLKKGEDAQKEIETRTGKKGVVEVWLVDMGDYDSVKAFAQKAEKELEHLHIACLNAGVAEMKFNKAQYGWEKTLQVNLLSTVLLGLLLLPKLKASKKESFTPVLELVSSSNHYHVTVKDEARKADSPLEVYNRPETYDGLPQYSFSKLFLQYAQLGMVKSGAVGPQDKPDVEIVTVCPGATKSTLARDVPFFLKPILFLFETIMMKPTEQGARTYISGTDLGGKGHGRFWRFDRIEQPAAGLTGPENEKVQDKIWQNVLNALRKDNPEIDQLLSQLTSKSP